jgi:hypothetical protein
MSHNLQLDGAIGRNVDRFVIFWRYFEGLGIFCGLYYPKVPFCEAFGGDGYPKIALTIKSIL